MSSIEAPEITVVQPGGGQQGNLGTIGVAFKLWGHDTGEALSIVEHPFPVGALVPPHLHTREDEYSIVTEGQIGFRSGDREVDPGPGGYITKPRGELHAMWNAGPEPARMIEVISPAGFEHFFREMADLTAAGPPQLPEIMALADRYGLQFGQPDMDLVLRRRPDHPERHRPGIAALARIGRRQDAVAAPGEAGVDAEHEHPYEDSPTPAPVR